MRSVLPCEVDNDEYDWLEGMKRELSLINLWKEQFNIGGVKSYAEDTDNL